MHRWTDFDSSKYANPRDPAFDGAIVATRGRRSDPVADHGAVARTDDCRPTHLFHSGLSPQLNPDLDQYRKTRF
jgi:hypothetical protein